MTSTANVSSIALGIHYAFAGRDGRQFRTTLEATDELPQVVIEWHWYTDTRTLAADVIIRNAHANYTTSRVSVYIGKRHLTAARKTQVASRMRNMIEQLREPL